MEILIGENMHNLHGDMVVTLALYNAGLEGVKLLVGLMIKGCNGFISLH